MPSDTPSSNKIYRSLGNGSFTELTGALGLQSWQVRKSDGTSDFILGDFSGSGSTEVLLINTAPAVTPNGLLTRNAVPVDLLASATAPSGATTSITYSPLHNSNGRYASDRGNATYKATFPVLDVTLPMFVATALNTDPGIGGANAYVVQTLYAYKGLKADYQGHGLLGFREVRQQGFAPNGTAMTSVTRYLQTDPYIGMPLRTETRLGGLSAITADQTGSLLSYTDNTFCDMTLTAAVADAASPTAPCAMSAVLKYPYLRKSAEGGYDLDGTGLPTTTTVTTFNPAGGANPTGDPTNIAVTTTGNGPTGIGTQTVTRTTVNTYQADDTSADNWIRGRLTKSTVTNVVPNSLGALATSAGSAANATAVTGDVSKAPMSAVLSAILSLLLND